MAMGLREKAHDDGDDALDVIFNKGSHGSKRDRGSLFEPWLKKERNRRLPKKSLDSRFLRLGGVLASNWLEKWTKRWENIRARSPQKLVYVAPQETLVLGGLSTVSKTVSKTTSILQTVLN